MTQRRPVALVTGGSRGIGASTARLLAERGWDVAIGYHAQREAADQVVADCVGHGADAIAVPADLAGEPGVLQVFAAVDDHYGRLDGFVNNAGIVPSPTGPVVDVTEHRLRRVLDVNVVAPFLAVREAVRRMSRSRGGDGGVVVNVSSRAAVRGGAGEYVDYAASKAALDAVTVGLAQEVAGEGIRVVGVRPGLIATDIHAPGRLEGITSTVPLGRAGEPEEVARAIAWLMSPDASYVTGTTLDVSGGR